MRRSEVLFLVLVGLFAAALAVPSLDAGRRLLLAGASGSGAGQVRQVDVARVRDLIARGALSSREALYYHRDAPPPAARPP